MDNKLLKVLMTSIPGRYARALFAYAQQANIIEKIFHDLEVVNTFCKENPQLWRELSAKVLTPKQMESLWEEVGKKLHLHSALMNFILLLSQAKRLSFWTVFIRYYQLLKDASQCKRQVRIHTPVRLSTHDQQHLSQVLQKLWNDELLLTYIVNPPLQMGMVVESNNLCLNVTLEAHLTVLRQTLTQTL